MNPLPSTGLTDEAIRRRVRRPTRGRWHLVESVIAGDAVTRCGRRMAHAGLTLGTPAAGDRDCGNCFRGAR